MSRRSSAGAAVRGWRREVFARGVGLYTCEKPTSLVAVGQFPIVPAKVLPNANGRYTQFAPELIRRHYFVHKSRRYR